MARERSRVAEQRAHKMEHLRLEEARKHEKRQRQIHRMQQMEAERRKTVPEILQSLTCSGVYSK